MKYTLTDYKKGVPELNLLRNQRILIIKALLYTKWNIEAAYKLNYPGERIPFEDYKKQITDHHISFKNKTFKKLKEIK